MPPLPAELGTEIGTLTHGRIEVQDGQHELVLPLALWAQQVMVAFDEAERLGYQVLDDQCRIDGTDQRIRLRSLS